MTDRLQSFTADLAKIADEARAQFATLSWEQLNWKPAAESWSVAQCLDHLIQTQLLYLPLFEKVAAGEAKASIWERISPFSGFFGRLLIRAVSPQNPKTMKTTSRAEPSASEYDGDLVERFAAHQAELIRHVESVSEDLDPKRTIVTSPLLGLVTYCLDDALGILVLHGQRHLLQARRVTGSEGFPA